MKFVVNVVLSVTETTNQKNINMSLQKPQTCALKL